MRKLEAMARTLNDDFREHLKEAVREKFGLEVETYFDLFGSMALVTRRVDGEDFIPEQHAYISAYMDGYGKALELVRAADR